MPRLPVQLSVSPDAEHSSLSSSLPDAHGWFVPKNIWLATTSGPLITFSPVRSPTNQPFFVDRSTVFATSVASNRSDSVMFTLVPVVPVLGSTSMYARLAVLLAALVANGCSRSPLPMTTASKVPGRPNTASGPKRNLRPAAPAVRLPSDASLWTAQLDVD